MKKVILHILFLACTGTSSGQQTEPLSAEPAPDINYLKRSKHQKTAAWILTSAGTAGLITTLMADATQAVAGGFTTIISLGTIEPEYKSYTAYYLLSAAGVGTGIAFFVAASKNKKRAAAASAFIQLEKAPMLQNAGFGTQRYPAVAIRVHLP